MKKVDTLDLAATGFDSHQLQILTGDEENRPISHARVKRRTRPSAMMWRLALMGGDTLLIITCILIALLTHSQFVLHMNGTIIASWPSKIIVSCFALIAWGFAVNILRAQELKYAAYRLSSPLFALFALSLALFCCGIITLPFVTNVAVYLNMLLFFTLLVASCLSVWRVAFAQFLSLPRFRQQAVIVGVSPAGATIASELRNARRPVVDVVGYISENGNAEALPGEMLPMLGDKKALRYLVRNALIDVIIMAIDYRESPEMFQCAFEAIQSGVQVLPMAYVYENTCGKIPVEHIGDQWFVTLPAAQPFTPIYLCWRKLLDLLFCSVGLLALLALFPVIALAIYLDSPGPLFYSHERLGYRGKPFKVLKFRSMRQDAERPGQAVWAKQNDPRTTRVGRFLRATHLDELPQVINILRGEMTLIGPRPERRVFVNELEKTIPFYRCRLSVKPGLTGWAQVKYPYTNSGHEALIKLQYDLYYIKHQSWMIDVLILLKTVVEVLLCHGR